MALCIHARQAGRDHSPSAQCLEESRMRQYRSRDLIAFIAVLLAALSLVALGLPVGQIATFASAVSVLYAAWHQGGRDEDGR